MESITLLMESIALFMESVSLFMESISLFMESIALLEIPGGRAVPQPTHKKMPWNIMTKVIDTCK